MRLTIFLLALLSLFLVTPVAYAQSAETTEDFYRGTVIEADAGTVSGEGTDQEFTQEVKVEVKNGPNAGTVITLHNAEPVIAGIVPRLKEGQAVILQHQSREGEESYAIYQPYRLTSLFWLFLVFVGLTILIGGKRGIWSLVGLLITILVLIKGVLPLIVSGYNPLLVCLLGSVVIACTAIYLSHGFSKRTTLAVTSTLITLFLSALIAYISVSVSHLFGLGSEEAYYVGFDFANINLRGLLLGAIIIGALGVLDDVTTTQTAVIHELHETNPKMSFQELLRRGLNVGKEHISSLVNTLVIAYAGASLPLFLLFTVPDRPLWVLLNEEFMAEEIVRTLSGSMTLVLAVPISTVLAALYYGREARKPRRVYS